MKIILITLACALIAPLAFAQTKSTRTERQTTATERVTVTGTFVTTEQGGTAASYQPANTLVVRTDGSRTADRYVLEGPGNVVDKYGRVIRTPIKPGAHVRIVYQNMGDRHVVDHVVVED